METKRLRSRRRHGGFILAALLLLVLAIPVGSSGQTVPGATVTVCQVTGSASAPSFAEVQVSVSEVTAFLNQYPGSFVGSCPSDSGGSGSTGEPVNGAVTVCRVSGSASSPVFSEVLVATDDVTVFLTQNPGSFVGSCPASSGGGGSSGTGPVNGSVTVCRVTGSASAPDYAELTLEVSRVAAFLNQNPGSFIGTCPGEGAPVTQGPGQVLGFPAGGALAVCQVTASGRALSFAQVNVAVVNLAAFLNQHPASFVGLCPGSGDANGTINEDPLGYVTICRVTGNADTPLAPITIRVSELALYLTRAGTIVPAPASGCPLSGGGGPGSGGGTGDTGDTGDSTETSEPSTGTTGETQTIVVQTTPNTVVTAQGAGVNQATKSDKKGKAKLTVTPKKKGIITVRADKGRVVKRIGVTSTRQSAASLTG